MDKHLAKILPDVQTLYLRKLLPSGIKSAIDLPSNKNVSVFINVEGGGAVQKQ